MKQTIVLISEEHRRRALQVIRELPLGHEVSIKEHKSTRSTEQNAHMWATLTDISEQVEWYGRKLSRENWKDIISAAVKKQDVVPGLDNNFVVLGQSTSKMTIAEMSELIECAIAFGTQRGVKWRAPDWME